MKAMEFKLPRDRTIASRCGLSIEFKKDVFALVPPAMFAEVIAAGGVSKEELPDDAVPLDPKAPDAVAAREVAVFAAFEKILTRNSREDFTAGGMPHAKVLAAETGWAVDSKERDMLWVKFTAGKD